MPYYDKEKECLSREEIYKLQEAKFIKQFQRVYNNVPYYRKKVNEKGIGIDDIKCLKDIEKLPFMSKEDLRLAYPDKLLACEKNKVIRVHSTSGTTGKRVIAFYTQNDIDLWEECCARALCAAGANSEDVCQIAYGFGLFTGGLGLYGASQKVGCLTLPMSSGNTDRQLQFMCDLGTTILCCTPSYAAYLAETINDKGIKDSIKLKSGIFGAEAWSDEMKKDIEKRLGIKAYDIYGLTELSGPGIAYSCENQDGMHINEDHFYVETINPDTLENLEYGQQGELVFTSLDKEAFPLIRYRTKDIAVLNEQKCECGRTFIKMSKPMGRSDDMLIVKGVNVFPSQIETVLIEQGYPANYQVIVDRTSNSDTMEVLVEMTSDNFTDNLGKLSKMEKDLTWALKTMLGIQTKVRLVAPKTIERSEGKAKRIIDKRTI